MEYSVQPMQAIQMIAVIGVAISVWRVKNKWFRITAIILIAIIFLVNPVRFKQRGIVAIEKGGPEFKVGERWSDNSKSFEQMQKDEMDKLKKESKNAME